jgi:glycosyltransferase involved in cell wall biosynthesis
MSSVTLHSHKRSRAAASDAPIAEQLVRSLLVKPSRNRPVQKSNEGSETNVMPAQAESCRDTSVPSPFGDLDVAIVHDYLNQRGGAERVVLELSDMWPTAPIYTSLYRAGSTFPEFQNREVRPTPLDRLPIDRGFRGLFPLYPAAFGMLGQINADVVLASSSGWAHMARSAPEALHVVYCYTPARWLYREEHLSTRGRRSIQRSCARPMLGYFRHMDRKAARRADLYIGISQSVQRRIKTAYGIDAALVYPPVDLDRFRPTPRGERLLVISRLLPYKRVELLVGAATQMGLGLDVVGDGPAFSALRELAGPRVAFHGAIDDRGVVELIEGCRAVCVAAEEDFGLVAVEAQAAGKPVVAWAGGGSLETVDDGYTGVFFRERTQESVISAINAADALATPPERIAQHARRFSRDAFRERLASVLRDAWEERRAAPSPSVRSLTTVRPN